MSMKSIAERIIHATPMGREWIDARNRAQRQRDWSTVHSSQFGKTEFSMFTNVGLGDVMIAKQICQEFTNYCELHGDPLLGRIVITAGIWPKGFRTQAGDHNIYWWWSMNGQDDWLETYLAQVNVKPDVVACLSPWCVDYARKLGCKTLYLPLAVGDSFQSLHIPREGVGFAGSKGHKDSPQVGAILGPFIDQPGFEWATNISTPASLGEFYNRKQITLGMTEIYQEKTGMVNNRVFEVLATGTPFLIHTHRALEEVLGAEFPYQSNNAEHTRHLAQEILAEYPKHLEIFANYQRLVDSKHRYQHRLGTLLRFLADRG